MCFYFKTDKLNNFLLTELCKLISRKPCSNATLKCLVVKNADYDNLFCLDKQTIKLLILCNYDVSHVPKNS